MLIYDKYIINFNDIYPIHRKYIVVLKIHYLKYRSGRFHYSKNIEKKAVCSEGGGAKRP